MSEIPATLVEAGRLLDSRSISSEELVAAVLARVEALNPSINAYITLTATKALETARGWDKRRAAGKSVPPLAGLPIAHKDIFCTSGVRTSCGSRMLDNFIAPYDATVVKKLAQQGAVVLGKTNMDEFAMGSSNETSYYGPVRNPWDQERVPGGSSGGSAAAVAAGMALAATGTDTGGSIRQPASFCGLTGLKPTYGRVSRYGMIAFASSLDQAGPLTRSAEDAALMLAAMAGWDTRDSTSIDAPIPDYRAALDKALDGLRIGLPRPWLAHTESGYLDILNAARAVLESLGASFTEVDLPHTELSIPIYYVLAPAECSANLARYDGVHYGYRCENPRDLNDLYCRSRAEGFGDEVKRRLLTGTYVLAEGFFDAYYLQAQRCRRLVQQDFIQAFEHCDLLLGPTTRGPAFALGAKTETPLEMYLEDLFTVSSNLAGLPAMSLPGGQLDGLPVGLQLIGPGLSEARLLNVGHRFQGETNWHLQTPGVCA